MPNKSRQKGDRFERRVKKYLESKGWQVIRSPKSAFPDLTALRLYSSTFHYFIGMRVECKWNKYLSNAEKTEALYYLSKGWRFVVAYNKIPKGKKRGKIKFYEMHTEHNEYGVQIYSVEDIEL